MEKIALKKFQTQVHGTLFYAFFFCIFLSPSLRLKREHHSGDKKRGCDIPFIYLTLIMPLLKRFPHTHTLALALKCDVGGGVNTSDLRSDNQKNKQTQKHNSVKNIFAEENTKNSVLGCSCWRQTGNQKIGESRVGLFHKALISCFISSSGWLPAGLVVLVPHVDTHSHTQRERIDNTWPSHLGWSQISQGSRYLFLLSYNMIRSACR